MRQARHALAIGAVLVAAAAAGCSSDSKLKVFGVEPTEGDYQGGTTVDIKGNGYASNGALNAKVFFGHGQDMRQGVVLRFDGDHDLYVTAPGGKKGDTVDVVVQFEGKGPVTIPKAFTYIETKGVDVQDLSTDKSK
jgi:hypothetical protein